MNSGRQPGAASILIYSAVSHTRSIVSYIWASTESTFIQKCHNLKMDALKSYLQIFSEVIKLNEVTWVDLI